jgi:hypothetical protein
MHRFDCFTEQCPSASEALFRFYGPEKPPFEKIWVLPDIEKTD